MPASRSHRDGIAPVEKKLHQPLSHIARAAQNKDAFPSWQSFERAIDPLQALKPAEDRQAFKKGETISFPVAAIRRA